MTAENSTAIHYRENALTAEDFSLFQRKMNWAEDPREQVERSLTHTLYSVTAYFGDELVAMGRLLGDAAMYWYLNDLFVLTSYQGQGIGREIVKRLIQYIRAHSLPGTSASLFLMAARGKEGFYEKLGFRRLPNSKEGAGMAMELDIP